MKTKLGINGIIVSNKYDSAFYSIFNNKVELDSCYGADGNSKSKEEDYFKSREKQLTNRYGNMYCVKHSRLMESGKCDICNGYKKN